MPHPNFPHLFQQFFLLIISFTLITTASATSIMPRTMPEIVAGSKLIFEGKVLSIEQVPVMNGRMTQSIVRFEVMDVIKGDTTENEIELKFLGGFNGGRSALLEGMQIPRIGEQGVYFVRDPDKDSVHPLKGWGQGHFLIRPDALGNDKISSSDGRTLVELPKPMKSKQKADFSGRAAAGLQLKQSARGGVNASSFKSWVRNQAGGVAQ